MKKLLVIELWGIGDGVIMSALLRSAPAQGWKITVLGKPHLVPLLQPSFPEIEFISLNAPWTVFSKKYQLWKWPWAEMNSVLSTLRGKQFDAMVSVRKDPRDALLMRLAGGKKRYGLPRLGSALLLLNEPVNNVAPLQHKVEDWWALARSLWDNKIVCKSPALQPLAYGTTVRSSWPADSKGNIRLLVHCGAGQPIRRWPESYFVQLIERLQTDLPLEFGVIQDSDGYGSELAQKSIFALHNAELGTVIKSIAEADVFIGNDSGLGHIAAALDKPTISIFGSQLPEWFKPFTKNGLVLKLSPPPSPPCFDAGGEAERRCLTELTVDKVFSKIHAFLETLHSKSSW